MSEVTTSLVNTASNAPVVTTVEVAAPVQLPEVKTIELPTPAAEKPVEDPAFSRKFSAISKRENALRQKEANLKAQEAAYNEYQASLAAAKANPLELLKAHGTTLEDLISYAIEPGNGVPTKEDELRATVEQIAAKVKEYEDEGAKYQEHLKEQKKQETLASINNDIKTFIHANSDTYELIKLNKVENEVWQIIEETYLESNGKVTLTQEQAATMLEKQLELETEEELERLNQYKQTKKYKAKNSDKKVSSNGSLSYQDSKTEHVSNNPSRQLAPTLTNNSISVGSAEPKRHLTSDESLREAAKLLKWK